MPLKEENGEDTIVLAGLPVQMTVLKFGQFAKQPRSMTSIPHGRIMHSALVPLNASDSSHVTESGTVIVFCGSMTTMLADI